MGQPRSQELERLPTQVLHAPGYEPPTGVRPSTAGSLFHERLRTGITLCLHE